MPLYYTGVGSRESSPKMCALMTKVAQRLRKRGLVLRSGHAQAADRAFEIGAGEDAVVYLPWPSFGQHPYKDDPGMPVLGQAVAPGEAALLAYYDHLVDLGVRDRRYPAKMAVKLLHGRNVCQVLGHEKGDPPSAFVVYWAVEPDGVPYGGTATAVLLARKLGIPTFNLGTDGALQQLGDLVQSLPQ